jgi:hypothetical protein
MERLVMELRGDPLPDCLQMAENALLPKPFSSLLTRCILVADAYRRYIPKGEGEGVTLRWLQGDPLFDRVQPGRRY